MKYIILDLEWDTAYDKKSKRFVNQILQIGAVKLNGRLRVIDKINIAVKPTVSKHLSKRFTNLTGITESQVFAGVDFDQAVEQYNKWAGTRCVTASWSTSDLFAIYQNEKRFLKGNSFNINKYFDLQKYVACQLEGYGIPQKNQISLADAAQRFSIDSSQYQLHNALGDCYLSAAIFKKCFDKNNINNFIQDTSDPEFKRKLFFKPYYIKDFNSPDVDKKFFNIKCDKCSVEMKRVKKWYYRNNFFNSTFVCPVCNSKVVYQVSFKKNYDNVKVRTKSHEVTNNELQYLPAQV